MFCWLRGVDACFRRWSGRIFDLPWARDLTDDEILRLAVTLTFSGSENCRKAFRFLLTSLFYFMIGDDQKVEIVNLTKSVLMETLRASIEPNWQIF